MNTKTEGIVQEDFDEFINEINKFSESHQVIATQTHYAGERWYAIIYYSPARQKADAVKEQGEIPAPTPLQLKHLDKNKQYLESIGVKFPVKTKNEATKILKSLWGEEI